MDKHHLEDLYTQAHRQLDARGLLCPEPVRKAKLLLTELSPGQYLHVIATDPHSQLDFEVFILRTGNILVDSAVQGEEYHFLLRKDGEPPPS